MDELLKAIIDAYNTGGAFAILRTANPNGLFMHVHKQNQTLPYMTYNRISDGRDFYMDGAIQVARVQFSIYVKEPSDLWNIYPKFITAFDGAVLSYDSDVAISCYVTDETGPTQMPDQSWQSTIDLEIRRDKQ